MSAVAAPPVPVRKVHIVGPAILSIWVLAAVALVWKLAAGYDAALIARYAPLYLSGLWTTFSLVAVSFVVGAVLSVPVAVGRRAENPVARATSFAFVYFFRGTPLIAQIYLIYYGLGQFRGSLEAVNLWVLFQYVPGFEAYQRPFTDTNLWLFFRDAWYCALFSLSLNTAAYQAEILSGSIASVPRGQWEGARSLGLSNVVVFWKVILPQAMIVALRPYANEIILMIKASAIVALVTVLDLMGETRRAYARTFDFQTYLWAAILYLAIVEVLRHATNLAERRLIRHLKR